MSGTRSKEEKIQCLVQDYESEKNNFWQITSMKNKMHSIMLQVLET